ncbi:MAG: hypothetical protein KA712_20255 [Myxococcales bacterium]|nr:hypothetical protein [Myxococcales bacterium]
MRRFFIALGFVLLAGACDDGGTSAPGDASPWPADAPWEDAALSGDAAAFDACLSCGDAPATPIDAAKDGGGEGSADAGLDAGPGDPTDAGPGDAHPPAHVDLRFERQFPIKAFASGQRFVVVLERPLHLTTEYGWPARSVRWIEADGRVVRSRGSSGLRYLLDVAVHPSGQTTLLFASNEGFSLERTDAEGALLGTFVLNDPRGRHGPASVPPARWSHHALDVRRGSDRRGG